MNPLNDSKAPSPFSPKLVLGLAIIVMGLLGFISQCFEWGLLERLWPLFLVGAGILIVRQATILQPKRSDRWIAIPPSPNARVSGDPESDPTTVKP